MSDKRQFAKTDRTTLTRRPHRGLYDRELIYQILDESYICNVAYVHKGSPMVLPTGYRAHGRLHLYSRVEQEHHAECRPKWAGSECSCHIAGRDSSWPALSTIMRSTTEPS